MRIPSLVLAFGLAACGEPVSRAIPDGPTAPDAPVVLASPDAGCATPADATAPGTLVIDADDDRRVWFNGQLIEDTGNGWQTPSAFTVAVNLSPARPNVIAVEGRNAFSQGGLDRGVAVDLRFGTHVIVTDASWKLSPTSAPGWETAAFDASAWPAAIAIGAMGVGPWDDVFGGFAPSSTAQWLWLYDPSTAEHEATKPLDELGYARVAFALPCGN